MTFSFRSLGLSPSLLETLDNLGYIEPTPIQVAAIPLLLAGHDVMGQAQTGTGKTAAFTLPTVQQLNGHELEMLILTPTRELAIQVSEAVYRYSSKLGMRVLPIYGGQSYDRQERRLKKGVHVVVGTPGRTLDLLRKGVLQLGNVRFLILDEADEMLKMGFVEDVEAILSMTDAGNRQTLLFSATLPSEIRKLAQRYMHDPQEVIIEAEEMTNEDINQRYYLVDARDKVEALSRILETEERQNTLIFTRTRVGSAELAETLAVRGFPAIAIHGDLAQNERERILNRFRNGQLNILVATDVVGRGVDIPDVSHVINFDISHMPIEYVHRIGRTGRAGRSGEAISLVTGKQKRLLRTIEDYIDRPIPKARLPTTQDIIQKREDEFMQRLVTYIQATKEPSDAVEQLMQRGFPPEQIATAVIQMLAEKEFTSPVAEIRDVQGRGKSDSRKRNHSPRTHEAGMVRLTIDAGRKNGIKPSDIVYVVASSARIPGKSLGRISIGNAKTYVDVPEQHVEAVLRARGGTIKGQQITVRRA